MIYSPKITRGKKLAIISPATAISLPQERIDKAYKVLSGLGVSIYQMPHSVNKSFTPKEVAAEIMDAVTDPEITGLMAFWGGSGTNAILEHLDYDLIRNNPKVFIGYSDTSALLQAVTTKSDIVTYLGAAAVTFSKPIEFSESFDSLKYAITKESEVTIIPSQKYCDDLFYPTFSDKGTAKNNLGFKTFRTGKAEGIVFAGTIAVLSSLIGTPYLFDPKDKILCLEMSEDHDFKRLVRWLHQFKQAGWFQNAKGLVLSKFTKASEVGELELKQLLTEVLEGTNFPVVYNADFGHTDPILTLPIGGFMHLDAKEDSVVVKIQY